MNYSHLFYLKKYTAFIFGYILLPISIFILLSPLSYSVLYFLENKVVDTFTNTSEKVFEQNSPQVLGITYDTELANNQLSFKSVSYRGVVLDKFFSLYNSPLSGYGNEFVIACDKYGAPKDCTTLAAIAFVETKLCTRDLSDQQKNCWGWGGSPPNRIIFPDYSTAIDTITRGLMNGYGYDRMADPKLMQFRYCGAHCSNWGNGVQIMRGQINQLAIDLGYPKLF